jgi:phage terminase large subunit GpA-like protein
MVGGAQGKGDVPLLMVATNRVKDIVDANLQRATPGPGYYHFPPPKDPIANPDGWLPKSFFDELKAEVRGDNGVWEQIKARNETFDHCVMIRAGCLFLKVDKRTFWDHPPAWAQPFALNADSVIKEVRQAEQEVRREQQAVQPPPAPAAPARVLERKVRRSSYLG